MSASEYLAEVKRVAEAATPGPWTMDNSGWSRPYHIPDRIVGGVSDEDWTNVIMPQDEQGGASWAHDEDAEFIARARTDVPRLVAALEAVLGLAETAARVQQVPLAPRMFSGDPFPAVVEAGDVIRAIESALAEEGGEGA